jgi:cell division septation protein DedD
MAGKEKKGGGDFILESRHLVGLFMLLVVIFAVVFTLGYLMGRSQYDSRLRAIVGSPLQDDPSAAASAPKSKAKSQHSETGTSSSAIPAKTGIGSTSTPPKPGAASTGSPSKPGPGTSGSQSKEDATQKKPDWDFYHSAEPKTTEDHLQPPKKPVTAALPPAQSAAPKPPAASLKTVAQPKESAPAGTPLVANGAIMLQVAAVQREGDAMALAQALQQKKFPAYVITPGPDKYYRVQVGPYSDNQSASNARHDLEANGFKSIIKR